MARMSGGKAVVAALEAEGVRHVFGLIGSAGMEIFDALHDSKAIRFIGVRDERTGVHMADGYARASGRAGVFLAGQNGPGATNLVTGLAQANAAYSPVVALAGSLSSAHVYRDAFQEVDQQALFRPVTKKTWTVTQAARIPEMVREAFTTALAPRRGPVVLNLPRDLLAEVAEIPDAAPPASHRAAAAAVGDPEAVRQAAQPARRGPSARSSSPAAASRTAASTRAHSRSPSSWELRSRSRPGMATRSPASTRSMPARWARAATPWPRSSRARPTSSSRSARGWASTRPSTPTTTSIPRRRSSRSTRSTPRWAASFPSRSASSATPAPSPAQLAAALAGHRPVADAAAWTAAFRDSRRKLLAERDATPDRRAATRSSPLRLYHALRAAAPGGRDVHDGRRHALPAGHRPDALPQSPGALHAARLRAGGLLLRGRPGDQARLPGPHRREPDGRRRLRHDGERDRHRRRARHQHRLHRDEQRLLGRGEGLPARLLRRALHRRRRAQPALRQAGRALRRRRASASTAPPRSRRRSAPRSPAAGRRSWTCRSTRRRSTASGATPSSTATRPRS